MVMGGAHIQDAQHSRRSLQKGHISIGERSVKPSHTVRVGDVVKVKVLNTNDGKISLSIKAVEEDREAEEREELDTAQFSSTESVGTSLGDLFKNLGF